jgi:hypothetical protein
MATKRKVAKRPAAVRRHKRAARAAQSRKGGVKSGAAGRIRAMAQTPLAVCESDRKLQETLTTLRDQTQASSVRRAALQMLQAASFSTIAFEPCRGDYVAALRAVVDDPDAELRERALGILAREKDGFAQKKLLDGLQNPDKALVAPEKALQLLANDVHAEGYAIARAMVKNPPNPDAKREALRLLAADATAAPLFESVLRDKDELREIRQVAASALQALRPEKMRAHAREMLMDKSEYDDIQATSLTALTHFGGEAVAQDDALMKSVDRLSGAPSAKVKQSARRFLQKYGR